MLQLSLRLEKQKFLNSENVQGGERKLQVLKGFPDQTKKKKRCLVMLGGCTGLVIGFLLVLQFGR